MVSPKSSPKTWPLVRFRQDPQVMAQQATKLVLAARAEREVIPFEGGVVAYGPTEPGGYWRLRWLELGRRRDTTARSRDEALAKAAELCESLNIGTPTSHLRAKGVVLVDHYLDPRRRPTRGTGWSQRHREEQAAYCRRFVLPVIAEVSVRDLRPFHFQRIIDDAFTRSVAAHLRTCISAMVAAGLEEGMLLARQDVLRGVRWCAPRGSDDEALDRDVGLDEAAIPTAVAVHALASGGGGANPSVVAGTRDSSRRLLRSALGRACRFDCRSDGHASPPDRR